MAAVVGALAASLLQREELVAQVDEGIGLAAAAERELEELAVEVECFVDVADFERDVVEADGAGFFVRWHGRVLQDSAAGWRSRHWRSASS